MEASALSHAARRGLLTRKSPLLKLKGDEQLIALVRGGNSGAFDIIVDRYQARLLGFCRQMIGSTEDAEDVLQEVFVNAYKAMMADNREINLRPWLYRIARNRSLNHLRKPKADAHESMDMVPMTVEGGTAEKVHNREEFRQLLKDVTKLPETQRAALLLREIDALSYEEIAEAMDTTVPSVKSLLVRARISLAEASQARMLTCGEVRVELAEAAEGLAKATGPVRRHVRDCEECSEFRKQLRSDTKVLAMLVPVGPLLALKAALGAKLGFGGSAGAGTAASSAGGTAAAGSAAGAGAGVGGAAAASSAAIGAGSAASGLGAVGSAVGVKAIAGVVTAAVLTAGAVEVKQKVSTNPVNEGVNTPARTAAIAPAVKPVPVPARDTQPVEVAQVEKASVNAAPVVTEPVPVPTPAPAPVSAAPESQPTPPAATPAIVESHTATPAHETDDGLVGTVEDVPYQPEPSTNPSVPAPSQPVTSPQIPVKPAPPVQVLPSTPVPSTPAPAPSQNPAPQSAAPPQAPAPQNPAPQE